MRVNELFGTEMNVLVVPNTYFGGDVAVAGLLSGQDLVRVSEKIIGDFVIVPKHIIKSDEPVLIDGMRFDQLKKELGVPVFALDTHELITFLSTVKQAS